MATISKKSKAINVGPQLYLGMFDQRVYFAKSVRARPDGPGKAVFEVVGDSVDVHASFEKVAAELGYARNTDRGSKA